MKITGKRPSREKCAESGWFATDYLMDAPIDREFILKLKSLGGFVYLDMLKQPFFKIENKQNKVKYIPVLLRSLRTVLPGQLCNSGKSFECFKPERYTSWYCHGIYECDDTVLCIYDPKLRNIHSG